MKKASPLLQECQPVDLTAFSNINTGTASAHQRLRLLAALSRYAFTTLDARRDLNVMAPAPRIFELRHNFGHNIQTTSVWQTDDQGNRHRVALYTLHAGKWKEGKQ
jgi:hypothetical protein